MNSSHRSKCILVSRARHPRDNTVRERKREDLLDAIDKQQRLKRNWVIAIDDFMLGLSGGQAYHTHTQW